MRSYEYNLEKTLNPAIPIYPLDEAAKKTKRKPRDLLYAGTHGKIKILVGVPPGYKLQLIEKSKYFNITQSELGEPRKWDCPQLLVLSKKHCHELEISGTTLLRDASYGYSINWSHQITDLKLPWESDERLNISEIGLPNYFDPRQRWNHWCIGKIGSGAELEVSLANLWVAKTEIDKLLNLTPDIPCNDGEEYKSDPFYIMKQQNQFLHTDLTTKNGKIILPKLIQKETLTEYLLNQKINFYRQSGLWDRKLNNVEDLYKSEMLRHMNRAAFIFWSIKPKNKKTNSEEYIIPCCKNEEVVKYLMGTDAPFSKKLAEAAATIIRPEYAAKGRNTKVADELDKDYIETLKKLKESEYPYKSYKLKYLNKIAIDFWCFSGVFKEDKSTFPEEELIFKVLVAIGFSESLASNAIVLIRPEFAEENSSSEKESPKSSTLEQDKELNP